MIVIFHDTTWKRTCYLIIWVAGLDGSDTSRASWMAIWASCKRLHSGQNSQASQPAKNTHMITVHKQHPQGCGGGIVEFCFLSLRV